MTEGQSTRIQYTCDNCGFPIACEHLICAIQRRVSEVAR